MRRESSRDREIHRYKDKQRPGNREVTKRGMKRPKADMSLEIHLWEFIKLSHSVYTHTHTHTHTLIIRGLLELHLFLTILSLLKSYMFYETNIRNIKRWPFNFWIYYKIYHLAPSRQDSVGRWPILYFYVPRIWLLTYVEFRKQRNPLNKYHNSLKSIKIMESQETISNHLWQNILEEYEKKNVYMYDWVP